MMNMFGIYPVPIPIPTLLLFELSYKFVLLSGIVLFSLLSGYIMNRYSLEKWNYESIFNLCLPVIAVSSVYLRYGFGIELVKGFVLFMLLLFASNCDIRTREITNWVPLAIAITGLIGKQLVDIPFMMASMIIIALPQLLIAMLKPDSYGGADIKLMAACSFLLGIESGFIAIILGLSIGLLITVIKRKLKNENIKEKFPIVPSLAFGSFLAFLIFK